MKKRVIAYTLFFIFFVLITSYSDANPQVNRINITPSLDITYYGLYNVTTNITNSTALSFVKVNLSGLNDEDASCWGYYTNGTCLRYLASEYNMTLYSKNIWKKSGILPDTIYPQIGFGDDTIFLDNPPLNMSVWRGSYQLFNYTNPFTITANTTFLIEFDAAPVSLTQSYNLYVYVVGNRSGLNYFTEDWTTKPSTELVATYSKDSTYDHRHSNNSAHYLVTLTTNSNGTIGNNINISGQFWVILFQDSVKVGKGWDLKYLNTSYCNNLNSWFIGEKTSSGTWYLPLHQQGCPNTHIHFMRKHVYYDGVNVTIIAKNDLDETSITSERFTYEELPNLAPLPKAITNPVAGATYNDTFINITWMSAIDPNKNDILTYNLSLLNVDYSFNKTLNVTLSTSYYWNITDISDNDYNLRIEVCDDGTPKLCRNITLDSNFSISKSLPVINLSFVSIISNNSVNDSVAGDCDKVTLFFNSTGTLINPTVSFYSAGYSVNNQVIILNDTNTYNASFVVNSSDYDGIITFEISAGNLAMVYTLTTDNSSVIVDRIEPTIEIDSISNMTYNTQSLLLILDSNAFNIWYNWNGTNTSYVAPLNIEFNEGSNTIVAWAQDCLNVNYTNVTFFIDIRAPYFTDVNNLTLYSGATVSVDFNASDNAGFGCWTVNDTSNFNITCDGKLTSIPALSIGQYNLNLTINDTAGNQNTTLIVINIISPVISSDSLDQQDSALAGEAKDFIRELNKLSSNNILTIKTRLNKGQTREIVVHNDKGTGVHKIILSSKDEISGIINISRLEQLPETCKIPEKFQLGLLYNALIINSTIIQENIENVSLVLAINNSWLASNDVNEIVGFKCKPQQDGLRVNYIEQNNGLEYYSFTSNSFSTWIILGMKRFDVSNETEIDLTLNLSDIKKSKVEETKWYDKYEHIKEFSSNWHYILLILALLILWRIYKATKLRKRAHKR